MPIDYKKLTAEVEGGLKNSRELRDHARRNFEYYSLQFEKHRVKHRDGRYQTDAVERYSPVLRRIADVLCGNLYKQEPRRILADAVASELLAKVYKRQRMGAKWKRADALTFVGGFQAFQFGGGDSVESPVVVNQWQPHELVVWTDPDDASTIAAVATVEDRPNALLKLWTRETLTTYKRDEEMYQRYKNAAGANDWWDLVGKKDNPYRSVVVRNEETGEEEEGVIPFSFAHWNFPCSYFDVSCPGNTVCKFNEHINRRLTMLGDSIEYQSRPLGYVRNMRAGFKMPTKFKPGDFIELVDDGDITGVNGNGEAEIGFLAPPVEHITIDWQELNSALDHMLEMNGVPNSIIRMVQSGAQSGLAIQSEQLPLLTWVEGRRGDWSSYEEDAARMALIVAESHTRANGARSEAARLQGMLDQWEFSVQWPNLYTQLPGPQRDQSDQFLLDQGILNKVTLVMQRNALTEAEAVEYLAKLKKQDEQIAAIGIDPKAASPSPLGLPAPHDVTTGEPKPPVPPQPSPQPQPKVQQ